jgi:hypothetical protein
MKKNLLPLFICLVFGLGFNTELKANVFSQASQRDTISSEPDTLHFFLTGIQPGGYGVATLKVIYTGDFGDSDENITLYGPSGSVVRVVGPNPQGQDCDIVDTVSVLVSIDTLNAWAAANDTLFFVGITNQEVGTFCDSQYAYIQLDYNFCLQGRYAIFSNTDTTYCNFGAPVALAGTPAGGVFSGPGVTGSSFNPGLVSPGAYTITYSTSDSGCISSATVSFLVSKQPIVTDTVVCTGFSITLAAGQGYFGWFEGGGLTNLLDTGLTYTTAPLTTATNFNVAYVSPIDYFVMTSSTGDSSDFIEQGLIAGDDRAGVAVTSKYAYVVGDDSTARYNLALDSASGVGLPKRDGIFTNLANGELYSLSDGLIEFDTDNLMDINMAIRMDSDLAYTTDTIHFSRPITTSANDYSSGVFCGYNFLIIYSDFTDGWYAVNLLNGQVDSLGTLGDPEFIGTENWATWGIAEFDGENYSVIYRSNDGTARLHRRVLPDKLPTVFATFIDLGETGSFCFLPSLNRLYLHTEYDSQFNPDGNSETLAYTDAISVHYAPYVPIGNCPSQITVNLKTVPSLGTDVAFCAGDSATLNAGAGYTSYSWNGVATNLPTFVVKQQGNVAIAVIDSGSCTFYDTVAVTVNALPAVTLALPFDTVCLGSSAITLTGATPAGGTFNGVSIAGGVLTPGGALLAGVQQVTYTYTDGNSCANSASDSYRAADCTVGINDLDGSPALSIYPNPSNGNFTLQLNSVSATTLTLVITDLTGKQVYTYQTTQAAPLMQLNLDMLQDGMYMLNAAVGKLNFKQRLVIQK